MRSIEQLDPRKLAIVIVDLQKGYCDPTSDCAVRLGWNVKAAERVCHQHVTFLAAARKLLPPRRIIWLRMEEHPDTIAANLYYMGGIRRDEILCERGTPGHDFHIVRPKRGERKFLKFNFSGFSSDRFRHYLEGEGINQLAVTGVVTSRCRNATILGASERGYKVIALTDLMGGPKQLAAEMRGTNNFTHTLIAMPMHSREFIAHLQLHPISHHRL
jgi:nicotinamidase-related amidase